VSGAVDPDDRVAVAVEAALDAVDGRPVDRWLDGRAGRRAVTVIRAIQAARTDGSP